MTPSDEEQLLSWLREIHEAVVVNASCDLESCESDCIHLRFQEGFGHLESQLKQLKKLVLKLLAK